MHPGLGRGFGRGAMVMPSTIEGTGMSAASAGEPVAVEAAELVLMNGFSLRSRGTVQRLSASAQRLVALVALQGRSVTRRRAAFTLWPDSSEAHAYGSLRTALFRLRSVCPGESLLECQSEF